MSVSGWFKYKQSGDSGEISSLLEKMSFLICTNKMQMYRTPEIVCHYHVTVTLLFLTKKYFECSSKQTMFHSPSLSECQRLMDLDDESWLQKKKKKKQENIKNPFYFLFWK